jgi:hypothetical protein
LIAEEAVGVEWRPIEGFPGYSVSTLGQVRKDSTRRVMHVRTNEFGVPYVGLMQDGALHQSVRSLPRLVAKAFVPQSNPVWDTPINKDGDRMNCCVDNLEWRPRWYAVNYAKQFRERYDHPIEEPVREIETDEEFDNSLVAACYYGLLEREVVLSIVNNTPTWPTFQKFVVVE